LIGMLVIVVLLATVELGYLSVLAIASPPVLLGGLDKLLDLFGKTLLVVIGIELIETLRALAAERVVRVEIVLTVAVIALARKILVLGVGSRSGFEVLGLAALLAALALAYRVYVRGARE